MDFQIKDSQLDNRMDCLSVICTLTIQDYANYIEDVFQDKGGIDGQRAPLKTKTAISIRKRMIDDIKRGAVLPPMVIGVSVTNADFTSIQENPDNLRTVVITDNKENISLIDGMQRTTAIKEALSINPELSTIVRIEFWISKSINNLIYRMLVLNTAQIPWSVKRQLEVVFSSIKKQILGEVPSIKLYDEDDKSRRVRPGEYQTNHIVELFLCFSLKKIQIDLKESIAEEFARLDVIESTSKEDFLNTFIDSLSFLVKLDNAFGKSNGDDSGLELKKFKKGMDVFASQPARVSLLTAISQKIFGRPGFNYAQEAIEANKKTVFASLDKFARKLDGMQDSDLTTFLSLDVLDERINIPSGKIGQFERTYFLHVFSQMLDYLQTEDLMSLEPVWVSYH